MTDNETEKRQVSEFADWILNIGNGTTTSPEGDEWIKVPTDILLKKGNYSKKTIVESIYPNLRQRYRDREFLEERAILCPRNETVTEINEYIMDQLEGDYTVYRSCDTVCKAVTSSEDADMLYSKEFLNNLKFPGIPNHEIRLKIGLPVMLMRNINQSAGLCNGTRMTITQLGKRFIEAQIITGTHVVDKVYIPRIIMSPTESPWPFLLKRRHYPISVCFAMTINKSQGQSLNRVGLYLPKQVFTHGQLYVAFSRVTKRDGLRVMVDDKESKEDDAVKNIVYKEIF
jgi:ATP-dependent DNA helicase PIF1